MGRVCSGCSLWSGFSRAWLHELIWFGVLLALGVRGMSAAGQERNHERSITGPTLAQTKSDFYEVQPAMVRSLLQPRAYEKNASTYSDQNKAHRYVLSVLLPKEFKYPSKKQKSDPSCQ